MVERDFDGPKTCGILRAGAYEASGRLGDTLDLSFVELRVLGCSVGVVRDQTVFIVGC